MQLRWTLPDLVVEVAARIAALPEPRNGQVRAVPDDRTIRYYATIGLLDRPIEMRGRTALYGRKHIAQVVAIKRLQTMGRSLSQIQALWPTLDDATLARMSGVAFTGADSMAPRAKAAKPEPEVPAAAPPRSATARDDGDVIAATPAAQIDAAVAQIVVPTTGSPGAGTVELRVELARNVTLTLSIGDDSVAISPAQVRALRAAAAPLVAELAYRGFLPPPGGSKP